MRAQHQRPALDKLTPGKCASDVNGNLAAAAQCVTVLAVDAAAAGWPDYPHRLNGRRFIGGFPGRSIRAKHGVVAMSHSINMQECINGIRSCVFLPGESATAILDKRPNPVDPEERARMVQPEDCADLILSSRRCRSAW